MLPLPVLGQHLTSVEVAQAVASVVGSGVLLGFLLHFAGLVVETIMGRR